MKKLPLTGRLKKAFDKKPDKEMSQTDQTPAAQETGIDPLILAGRGFKERLQKAREEQEQNEKDPAWLLSVANKMTRKVDDNDLTGDEFFNFTMTYNRWFGLANENGDCVLHRAAITNNQKVVKAVLEFRADINIRNAMGNTPLMLAAECGHENMVSLLLDKGANPALRNNTGHTAANLAGARGYRKIADHLDQVVAARGGMPAEPAKKRLQDTAPARRSQNGQKPFNRK